MTYAVIAMHRLKGWVYRHLGAAGGKSNGLRAPNIWTRALVTASASLFAFAAYGPWVVGDYTLNPDPGHQMLPTSLALSSLAALPAPSSILSPQSLRGLLVALGSSEDYLWCGLTVLGLLVAPFLWEPTLTVRARLGLWCWTVWLAIVMALTVYFALQLLGNGYQSRYPDIVFSRRDVGWGLWLAAVSLVGAGLAAIALWRDVARQVSTAGPRMPRLQLRKLTQRELWPAVLASASVTVWGLGFFTLPWATSGCSTVHFALNLYSQGNCSGIDAGDALGYAIGFLTLPPNSHNPVGGLVLAIYLYLAVSALVAVAELWRMPTRWIHSALSAAVVLWLAFASAVALLGVRGVAIIDANHTYNARFGLWQIGPGLVLACVGLSASWLTVLSGVRSSISASSSRSVGERD